MKYKFILPLVLFLFTAAAAQTSFGPLSATPVPPGPPLDFPAYGFRINPLEGPAGNDTVVPLTMVLSRSGQGVPPNVNVMLQPYAGNINDFIAMIKKQFAQAGAKIVVEKNLVVNEWSVEYTALFQGKAVHCYSRAIIAAPKVYIVTGTTLIEQWPQYADKIEGCVDSFQVTVNATPAAAPPAPAPAATSGNTSAMRIL